MVSQITAALDYDFETGQVTVVSSGRVMGNHDTLTEASALFPGVVFSVANAHLAP
jgi:hypothetical protein